MGLAKLLEAGLPLWRPVSRVGPLQEVVPDVLRLPDVHFEWHGAYTFRDFKCPVESAQRSLGMLVSDGSFKANHGALHPLAGCEREDMGVERDVVDVAPVEQIGHNIRFKLLCFDRPAEARVNRKACGQRKRGRRIHPGFCEEVQQRGMILIDFAERLLHFTDGLIEDGVQDAVLLISEKGS